MNAPWLLLLALSAGAEEWQPEQGAEPARPKSGNAAPGDARDSATSTVSAARHRRIARVISAPGGIPCGGLLHGNRSIGGREAARQAGQGL